MPRYLLFPGRHHLLTRFQAEYLSRLAAQRDGGPTDGGEVTVVWAVTSANHENTRRNPVPYHRREAAIERFSVLAGLRSVVVPIFDTTPTDRFAEVTVKTVAAATGLELTPADTVIACSTPEVAAMYERLGFRIAGVEADVEPTPARPWDVLLRLADGDPSWRDLAHPATLDVYARYRLDELVRSVVNDPVVGDEGGLTATRDYRTYAEAFTDAAQRKWDAVREHVRPGRIVDIGCGAGAVLELADRDPALRESDLIGVEVARQLFEECVHKKAQGVFSNPNVFFYRRNVLGGAVFAPRSVDTTMTFALTHEIWSYGDRMSSLRRFVQAIYDHTVPGGVWINSDVCGPDGRDRPVRLRLATTDGANPARPRTDLASLTPAEVAGHVRGLSTRARLDQFAVDYRFPFPYRPLDSAAGPVDGAVGAAQGAVGPVDGPDSPGDGPDGAVVELPLGAAMDFLTRKDYPDNWLSETQEQFCGLEWADWKALLADVGFEVDPASGPFRNEWIVTNRLAPVAALSTVTGAPLDWPVTHVLLVARRPVNT
ncbi:class I SAM-dependent methyltransferase [Micromonospora cathayae]|uniref:Class I SAM-dependent methyltransferase n=1 Tax=Micromonospora cathayae TaxID=3028804 RepID=A0ABY7ZXF6_9ACTN|nr:class I SAM-dependent methyltransferase [Micromonospora sp. HUAS 3]WDZ87772.1 class I SAM-dependent methyltransferase [Micromonospora sp. HUAS 3]